MAITHDHISCTRTPQQEACPDRLDTLPDFFLFLTMTVISGLNFIMTSVTHHIFWDPITWLIEIPNLIFDHLIHLSRPGFRPIIYYGNSSCFRDSEWPKQHTQRAMATHFQWSSIFFIYAFSHCVWTQDQVDRIADFFDAHLEVISDVSEYFSAFTERQNWEIARSGSFTLLAWLWKGTMRLNCNCWLVKLLRRKLRHPQPLFLGPSRPSPGIITRWSKGLLH